MRRRLALLVAFFASSWPVAQALAGAAATSTPDPVWLRAIHVVIWPAVVVIGVVLAVSRAGVRLLSPILQRIKGVSVGGVKLDFTEEAAIKIREDLTEVFARYREDTKVEFDRLARQFNISFLRSRVINETVIPQLTPEAQKDFRCTVHVQDLLFAESLYQLLDYAPQSPATTRGRAFPIRFGILGRAWRAGESTAQGKVSTDPKTLIVDWGMTSEEATAAGRGRQSFACVFLSDAEGAPLGVFYLDSMQPNAFGSDEDQQKRFLSMVERSAKDVGLTGALAKLVEQTRARGPQIRVFDQA